MKSETMPGTAPPFTYPCTYRQPGVGKLGFGKLGRGTTSKSARVKVDILVMFC